MEEEEEANEEIIGGVTSLKKATTDTESLSISAILSLEPNTFIKILGRKYKLSYYEIHFISRLNACRNYPKILYESCQQRLKNDPPLFYLIKTVPSEPIEEH